MDLSELIAVWLSVKIGISYSSNNFKVKVDIPTYRVYFDSEYTGMLTLLAANFDNLNTFGLYNKVWVPVYIKVEGNEAADVLAKNDVEADVGRQYVNQWGSVA